MLSLYVSRFCVCVCVCLLEGRGVDQAVSWAGQPIHHQLEITVQTVSLFTVTFALLIKFKTSLAVELTLLYKYMSMLPMFIGANPNVQRKDDLWSPLFMAAMLGRTQVANLLLQVGFNPILNLLLQVGFNLNMSINVL